MTAQQYIYQALRKIGQLRPGYTSQPELLNDALTEWQAFFDELNAERTMNYSNPDYVYPVTGPGSQSNGNGYDVGPTATNWVGPRPESIIRANLVMTSQGTPVYIPLRPVSQEEWAALAIRSIPASSVTSIFWYDPQFPNGVFNVFPPLNGNSIELFTWGVLAPPATLGATWAGPPAYWDMVVYGLAERLYFMVTKDVLVRTVPYELIAGKAKMARDKIRRVNRPIPRLATDAPRGTGPSGFYDRFVTSTGEPF